MQAFHSDRGFKDRFLRGMIEHRDSDRLQQGTYGELQDGLWRGCTIACQLLTKDLSEVGEPARVKGNARREIAEYLDIPYELAVFQDLVFEGLPPENAQQWAIDFLTAIRCGADLTNVWAALVDWMFGGLRNKDVTPLPNTQYFRAYMVGSLLRDYETQRAIRHNEDSYQVYANLAKRALELVMAA